MASTEVHILDRFLPELENYLMIDDIGCFLVSEGLLSTEDYLVLTKCSSKKQAVVEMLQLVKRKGPDSIQSFLHGLYRSCTEASTPHQGHIHLWQLFTGTNLHPAKKQKSKSVLSLLTKAKRSKHSKSNKDVSSPLLKSTPHMYTSNVALNNYSYNPSASHPASIRDSIISSATLLSDGSPSDEDSYRNSMHYSTSSQSQDSYNNLEPPMLPPAVPPPHVTITDHSAIVEELQKENKKLKKNLKKEAEELEKYKAKVKEQSLCIEDLKADKEKYKSKIQTLEVEISVLQAEANEDDSLKELEREVASLQLKIQRVMQEKESYKKTVQGSSRRTRSLGYGASRPFATNSASLTSINEIEELRGEFKKKDKVFKSKLGELTQMCEKSSRLNKRWHSEARLSVHQHHREDDYLFLQSQS